MKTLVIICVILLVCVLSLAVGYMNGYDDAQAELQKKQSKTEDDFTSIEDYYKQ